LDSWTAVLPPASSGADEPPGRETVECTIYDVDGTKVNAVTVEFPGGTVGVVELEPYASALKLESGMQHGHVEVVSRAGSKHSCRLVGDQCSLLVGEPVLLRSRDSSFLPITLSTQREQLLVAINAGTETAQLSCRLFYGARSPEWNIIIPPNGSKVVSVYDELLVSQDDRSWEKAATQAYLRITSRYQGPVSCFGIERIPGESLEQDVYRTLALT
jgi:hypothetical protein